MALDTSIPFGTSPRWELYRVLSEPVRLRLLALAAEEELAIGELADLLGESQPNVSRHTSPLKAVGLVSVRREGTRALVRLADGAGADAVVSDALESGRALVRADGSLAKVAAVVREREASGREFFARPQASDESPALEEAVLAYVAALSSLLPARSLAVDAGTGDGALLDVLAPAFERVIAIDRSPARLEVAERRVRARGYQNVELVSGEIDDAAITAKLASKADVVFAARVLHHAPKPVEMVAKLTRLCRPANADAYSGASASRGGALLVLDYAPHEDESMRHEADVWLGFAPEELLGFASAAGLVDAKVVPVSAPFRGKGRDAHLPWQLLVAHRGSGSGSTSASTSRIVTGKKPEKAHKKD